MQKELSVDLSYRITKLNEVIRGWINYFSLASMKTIITNIDSHVRSMIRTIIGSSGKRQGKDNGV
jgi:predicted XRE-type DNA-binding protein